MERELLVSLRKKDFEVQTFCSGGPGGQHQNKTESGVRIIHRESGAVGESRDGRCQHRNKQTALHRLTKHPKFLIWISHVHAEAITGKTLEARVEEQLAPKNLRIDIKDDQNRWVPLEE